MRRMNRIEKDGVQFDSRPRGDPRLPSELSRGLDSISDDALSLFNVVEDPYGSKLD